MSKIKHYKEPKTYKGFEVWWHSVQMSAKMYTTVFLICLLLQLFAMFLLMWLFQKDKLSTILSVFTVFAPSLWLKALKLFLKMSLLYFFLTLPVWLAFPALLGKFKLKAKAIMRDEYIRGNRLVSEEELKREVENDVKEKPTFYVGTVPIPRQAETRHFFVVGRSGTGKTRLLYSFVQKIRQTKGKAIIYDFKGDYVSAFFDPTTDHIFNPVDIRTVHWCLFSEIETYADIDAMAASLIPPSRGEDKFWVDGARDIFSAILFQLKIEGKETNQAIWDMVSLSEKEMLQLMSIASSKNEAAKRALGYLLGYEKGSKVASDVLSTMRQYTNCFFYTRHLSSQFSLKRWLESEEGGFLFLVGYPKLRDSLRPLMSLFIDTAIRHVLSMPEDPNRRIFFVIDEFVTLQKLTTIIQGLEQGRSKGLGLILAMQDISQLERIYHESANSIVNNCSTIVSFAVNDPKSQEYLSRVFGEVEILETDESLSMGPEDIRDGLSLTRRRKVERLILPSQFGTLPDLHAYVKILHYPVALIKIPFVSVEPKVKAVEFDPRFTF